MMIARNTVLDTHSSKVSLAYISRTSATQGLHPWNGSGAQFGVCITLDGENGMGMNKMKSIIMAVWQFVSYLFWPQKTDKTRYDSDR